MWLPEEISPEALANNDKVAFDMLASIAEEWRDDDEPVDAEQILLIRISTTGVEFLVFDPQDDNSSAFNQTTDQFEIIEAACTAYLGVPPISEKTIDAYVQVFKKQFDISQVQRFIHCNA